MGGSTKASYKLTKQEGECVLLVVAGAATSYVRGIFAAHETLAVAGGSSIIDIGFFVARKIFVGGRPEATGGFSEFSFRLGVVEVEERVADDGRFIGVFFGVGGHREKGAAGMCTAGCACIRREPKRG